ncbi:hypothetical protein BaRGS_00026461 [Batillaria attramentaria]|uniref:Uncharacterized protein n=1 Tax=Batillaria attramentaria TaxID=370345 RepID=A0ABD0K636_9CAEN
MVRRNGLQCVMGWAGVEGMGVGGCGGDGVSRMVTADRTEQSLSTAGRKVMRNVQFSKAALTTSRGTQKANHALHTTVFTCYGCVRSLSTVSKRD